MSWRLTLVLLNVQQCYWQLGKLSESTMHLFWTYTGKSFQVSGSFVVEKLVSSCSTVFSVRCAKMLKLWAHAILCSEDLHKTSSRMPRILRSGPHCCICSMIRRFSSTETLLENNASGTSSGPTYHKWRSIFFSAASATALFTSAYCLMFLYNWRSLTGASDAKGHEIQAFTYTWQTNKQNSVRFLSSFVVILNCSRKSIILKEYMILAIHLAWWTAPGSRKWYSFSRDAPKIRRKRSISSW